ncbi:MAG: hypothetical protein ACYDBZ_17540 [Steroidobacteraceae bacterium]
MAVDEHFVSDWIDSGVRGSGRAHGGRAGRPGARGAHGTSGVARLCAPPAMKDVYYGDEGLPGGRRLMLSRN